MADEAMRAAFEAWADEEAINNFHRAHCFDAWQAATLAERERVASQVRANIESSRAAAEIGGKMP